LLALIEIGIRERSRFARRSGIGIAALVAATPGALDAR